LLRGQDQVAEGYDDCSWIENGLFRFSKQFWTLTRWFPKRTAAGVRCHLTFVVLLLAVATALRVRRKAQAGAVPPPLPVCFAQNSSRAGVCPRCNADHMRARGFWEELIVGGWVDYPYWFAPKKHISTK
jgi:hypothetical protein